MSRLKKTEHNINKYNRFFLTCLSCYNQLIKRRILLLELSEKDDCYSLEEFFLDRKILTEQQSSDVRRYKEDRQKFLGNYAIDLRMLTISDVDAVLEKQRFERKFFGEIAVDMGKLDKAQVDFLLNLQQKNTLHFGEASVRLGYMSTKNMLHELNEFMRVKEFIKERCQEKEALFIKKFHKTLVNSVNILHYENVVKKFIMQQTQDVINIVYKDCLREIHIEIQKDKETTGYFLVFKGGGSTHSVLLDEHVLFDSFNGKASALEALKTRIQRLLKQTRVESEIR